MCAHTWIQLVFASVYACIQTLADEFLGERAHAISHNLINHMNRTDPSECMRTRFAVAYDATKSLSEQEQSIQAVDELTVRVLTLKLNTRRTNTGPTKNNYNELRKDKKQARERDRRRFERPFGHFCSRFILRRNECNQRPTWMHTAQIHFIEWFLRYKQFAANAHLLLMQKLNNEFARFLSKRVKKLPFEKKMAKNGWKFV